jgi:hypothetical protein
VATLTATSDPPALALLGQLAREFEGRAQVVQRGGELDITVDGMPWPVLRMRVAARLIEIAGDDWEQRISLS